MTSNVKVASDKSLLWYVGIECNIFNKYSPTKNNGQLMQQHFIHVNAIDENKSQTNSHSKCRRLITFIFISNQSYNIVNLTPGVIM
jgi:hypothetical protein